MTNLYTSLAIRELESQVIATKVDSEYGLMQKAGSAALREFQREWPTAQSVSICCGKGNNAGDGYVFAQLAYQAGYQVTVWAMSELSQLTGAALQAATDCKTAGVTINRYKKGVALESDVIVDALLGTGLKGEVRGRFQECIEAINALAQPVLAIDVPSGLDADVGDIMGCSVQAELTVTFIGHKQGLFTHKAPAYCGTIVSDALEVPEQLFANTSPSAKLLDWNELREQLPKRRRDAHKGDYGHVLVVGGDYGMGGAVRMAAEAAMRVGAGLVTVATRPEHVPVVSGSRPELMCHQVATCDDLEPLLARATVVVVGPGLGQTDWAQSLLDTIIKTDLPKVLDADSLNLLSKHDHHANNWILTPHPGEAARLLEVTSQEIQDDRFTAAEQLQQRYGGVIILKGVGTIIKSANDLFKICRAGNPGMASGGMGDVLSGVIGGLLAQKLSLSLAAETGVMVHSVAADLAAQEEGERGLLATDLITHLRKLVNPVENHSC